MARLLAIDIGNTHLTLGLWDGTRWRNQWRLHTSRERTEDEYGIDLQALLNGAESNDSLHRVVIGSVVPGLTRTIVTACERYLGLTPLLVGQDLQLGIRIATDNPHEVGADRIANAVATHHLYPGPAIVIDMGTATTFDIISRDGDLLGVVIATGLQLSADALAQRAAQLSNVALTAPPSVIARNTIHAVQAGHIFGYASLIEGLVARIKRELNEPDTQVIGTGGLIQLVTPHTDVVDFIDPYLTLMGLRLIAEHN
jgi:type III pantothenate kinase